MRIKTGWGAQYIATSEMLIDNGHVRNVEEFSEEGLVF